MSHMSAKCHIIGICGKKFNGKDTIADHLISNYGYTKISFGDSLKKAVQCIFGFSDEQLWGSTKEIKDPYWNISPREVLQCIGTDCMRIKFGETFPHIGDNIWIMSLRKTLDNLLKKGVTKIVIPDIRFPNEATMLKNICHESNNSTKCHIIRVSRPDLHITDSHVSENMLDRITFDYDITNNTKKQLFKDIDELLQTIQND